MGVLWTQYSLQYESYHPCSRSVRQSCIVGGGGEEAQVVLRQHQRHYHNITNSVYMLCLNRSICRLHWRKRRAITAFSEMETEVQPKQDEVDSSLQEAESGGRDGRFLLYWITTTSISTPTSYTITYSVSSAACTPVGANDCGR